MPAEETGAAIGRAAGRFVRAAGLAGLAAAREFEKKAAAPPAPPADEPVEEARAEPAPPPVEQVRRGRPAPAPSLLLDTFVYWGWIACLIGTAIAIISADTLVAEGSGRRIVELVIAGVFLVVGWLLVSDWWQARRRLQTRLLTGKRGQRLPGRGLLSSLSREILTLAGIAWLALGLWYLIRGLTGGAI